MWKYETKGPTTPSGNVGVIPMFKVYNLTEYTQALLINIMDDVVSDVALLLICVNS